MNFAKPKDIFGPQYEKPGSEPSAQVDAIVRTPEAIEAIKLLAFYYNWFHLLRGDITKLSLEEIRNIVIFNYPVIQDLETHLAILKLAEKRFDVEKAANALIALKAI